MVEFNLVRVNLRLVTGGNVCVQLNEDIFVESEERPRDESKLLNTSQQFGVLCSGFTQSFQFSLRGQSSH